MADNYITMLGMSTPDAGKKKKASFGGEA